MADILIRKVSDDTKERLAEAAANAGASLEAFLRGLLDAKAAELPRRSNDEAMPMSEWVAKLFADIDMETREAFAAALDNLPYPDEEFENPFAQAEEKV